MERGDSNHRFDLDDALLIKDNHRALAGGLVAAGGIHPGSAEAIARAGVDLLSVGWLTHSAPALDVALDVE